MSDVSDFDNFDDLDSVRDFRSLATPYPGSVDTVVRHRIVELVTERSCGPTSPAPGPERAAGASGSRCDTRPGAPAEDGGSAPPIHLRSIGRASTRRHHHRFMVGVALVVALGATAALVARRVAPGRIVEIDAAGGTDGSGASAGILSVDGLVELVRSQPDEPLPAGAFEYRRTDRGRPALVVRPGAPVETGLDTEISERWAGADRAGKARDTRTAPADGSSTTAGRPADRRLPPDAAFDGLSYQQLRDLPSDPVALRTVLDLNAADSPVMLLLDRLAESVVPPKARAALVSLLREQGLTARGPGEDRARRPGHVFTVVDDAGALWSLVIDPRTGELQGWERRRTGATAPEEHLIVLDREIVFEVPAS